MGYRSSVTMLLYGEEKDFPILKLWVDENLMPALEKNDWVSSESYREEVFQRGADKGYAFEFADVKWYESYEDVQAVEQAWEKFLETFDPEDTPDLCAEFARIGEDYSDVEYRDNRGAHGLLNIVRHTEY